MTNIDRAAEIIERATRGTRTTDGHHMKMSDRTAQIIAEALADEGMLTPDLPEPDAKERIMATCTSPHTAHWLHGVHLTDSDGHVYATLGAPDTSDIVTFDNQAISHVVENAFADWTSERDIPAARHDDQSPHAMRSPILARNRIMECLCGVNVLHPHGLDDERYAELLTAANAAVAYYSVPSVNGFQNISARWIEAIADGLITYFWLRTCDERGRRFEGPVPGVSRSRIRGIMRA